MRREWSNGDGRDVDRAAEAAPRGGCTRGGDHPQAGRGREEGGGGPGGESRRGALPAPPPHRQGQGHASGDEGSRESAAHASASPSRSPSRTEDRLWGNDSPEPLPREGRAIGHRQVAGG